MKTPLVIFLLFALNPLPAAAINKCIGADGKVVYTDEACPMGSKQIGKVTEMPPPRPEDVQRARTDATNLIERQARDEALREKERKEQRRQAREEKERAELLELERRKVEALEAQAKTDSTPAIVIVPQPVVAPRPRNHRLPMPSAAQSRPQRVPETQRKDGVRLQLRAN